MSEKVKVILQVTGGLIIFGISGARLLLNVRPPLWIGLPLSVVALVCFILLLIDLIKNKGKKGSPPRSGGHQ